MIPNEGFPVLELQAGAQTSRATRLCGALSSSQPTAVSHLQEFWCQLHTSIDQPIGPPASTPEKRKPRQCLEAGVCLCQGEGKRLFKLRQSFVSKMKQTFDTAQSKALLCGGEVFARAVAHHEDPTQETVSFCWHISLMYLSPYRPTFLRVKEVSETGTAEKPLLEVQVMSGTQ